MVRDMVHIAAVLAYAAARATTTDPDERADLARLVAVVCRAPEPH